MSDYHINFFYGEEDGGYITEIPDLEYCSAFGDSRSKALAEVERAKNAWLEAAREAGKFNHSQPPDFSRGSLVPFGESNNLPLRGH